MAPYLVMFCITTLIIRWAEINSSKKRFSFVLLICAVAIVAFFSGIRTVHVGTDTVSYMREFILAQDRLGNFRGLYLIDNKHDIEMSFLIIEYVCARFKYGFHIMLFAYAFITHLFLILGIRAQAETFDISMPFSWLLYCLLFYNATLNNMRQWVSIAIIFYVFSSIKNLKFFNTLMLTIMACMFHNSGMVIIFMYMAYYVFSHTERESIRLKAILLSVSLIGPFILPKITSIIVTNYVTINRYSSFIYGRGANRATQVDKLTLIVRIIFLIAFLIQFRNDRIRGQLTNYDRFYLYVSLIDVAFPLQYNQLNLRIGNYFSIFEVNYFPKGMKIFLGDRLTKMISNAIILLLITIYWYTKYMLWNNNETYPYSMIIHF